MKRFYFLFAVLFITLTVCAQSFVTSKKEAGAFVIGSSQPVTIYIDGKDDWLVNKAATLLQTDIEMVTGKKPVLVNELSAASKNVIIVGTIGGSSIIKKLTDQKKIDVSGIKGKWEAFQLQTLNKPLAGIENALIITGSDKRGAAYGVFELSKQIGVSPWYWWADVPVKKKAEAFVKKGVYKFNSPSVKYRGIFIKHEAPALNGMKKKKLGGVKKFVY
jgi:hypothetical protein